MGTLDSLRVEGYSFFHLWCCSRNLIRVWVFININSLSQWVLFWLTYFLRDLSCLCWLEVPASQLCLLSTFYICHWNLLEPFCTIVPFLPITLFIRESLKHLISVLTTLCFNMSYFPTHRPSCDDFCLNHFTLQLDGINTSYTFSIFYFLQSLFYSLSLLSRDHEITESKSSSYFLSFLVSYLFRRTEPFSELVSLIFQTDDLPFGLFINFYGYFYHFCGCLRIILKFMFYL